MRCLQQAISHFDSVLRLQPEHNSAQKGRHAGQAAGAVTAILLPFLCVVRAYWAAADADAALRDEAASMMTTQTSDAERAAASALRGERSALPAHPMSNDAAAEQLLAAEAMLRAQPRMEGPRCAHAEALILCRAYDAALQECARLQPGSLDALYLIAEAQWRGGKPELACATLATESAARSVKCVALASFVKQLQVCFLWGLFDASLWLPALRANAQADLAAADATTSSRAGPACDAVALYTSILAYEQLQGTHMQVRCWALAARLSRTRARR
jgi:hypothetical protein